VLVTGCSQAIHQANETYYQYQIAEREAYADAIAAVKDNPTAVLAIAMAYQGKHMTYGQRIDTVADYLRAIGATVRDVTPLVNTVVQRDGGGSGGHISAGRDVIFHSTKADRISAGAGVFGAIGDASFRFLNTSSGTVGGDWAGAELPNTTSGFAGVKVKDNGNDIFAWLRFSVENNALGQPIHVTLIDWAYEDSGAAIITGATTA